MKGDLHTSPSQNRMVASSSDDSSEDERRTTVVSGAENFLNTVKDSIRNATTVSPTNRASMHLTTTEAPFPRRKKKGSPLLLLSASLVVIFSPIRDGVHLWGQKLRDTLAEYDIFSAFQIPSRETFYSSLKEAKSEEIEEELRTTETIRKFQNFGGRDSESSMINFEHRHSSAFNTESSTRVETGSVSLNSVSLGFSDVPSLMPQQHNKESTWWSISKIMATMPSLPSFLPFVDATNKIPPVPGDMQQALLEQCVLTSLQLRKGESHLKKLAKQNLKADGGKYTTEGYKRLQPSQINDDFCDCLNGIDEPGTGACAGTSWPMPHDRRLHVNLFLCINENSKSKYIYGSHVGDGLCDCCDGSDEEIGMCKNTCDQDGIDYRRRKEEWNNEVQEAMRVTEERKAEIGKKRQELQQKVQSANEKKKQLQDEVDRLKVLHEKEDAERRQQEEALKAKRDAELRAERERIQAEAEKAKQQAAQVTDQATAPPSGDHQMAASDKPALGGQPPASSEGEASTADSATDEKPKEGSEAATKEGGETASQAAAQADNVSEYAKWMDKDAGLLEGESGHKVSEQMEGDSTETAEESTETAEESNGTAQPHTQAYNAKLGELRNLDSEVEEAQTTLEELEKYKEFAPLVNQCLQLGVTQYMYEFCFFKFAKQNHVRLGNFESFDLERRLVTFGGGDICPGNQPRSARVFIDCGKEEKVTHVHEPERCTYEARIQHPAACGRHLLDQAHGAPDRPKHYEKHEL